MSRFRAEWTPGQSSPTHSSSQGSSSTSIRSGRTLTSIQQFKAEAEALDKRKRVLGNSDTHLYNCRGFMPMSPAGRAKNRKVERLRRGSEASNASKSSSSSAELSAAERFEAFKRRNTMSTLSSGTDFTPKSREFRRTSSSITITSHRSVQESDDGSYETGRKSPFLPVVQPERNSLVRRHSTASMLSTTQMTSLGTPAEIAKSTTKTHAGGASVVVQERVIVVTPSIKITRSTPTPEGGLVLAASAPDMNPPPSEDIMTKELASIANSIKPIKPYNAPPSPRSPRNDMRDQSSRPPSRTDRAPSRAAGVPSRSLSRAGIRGARSPSRLAEARILPDRSPSRVSSGSRSPTRSSETPPKKKPPKGERRRVKLNGPQANEDAVGLNMSLPNFNRSTSRMDFYGVAPPEVAGAKPMKVKSMSKGDSAGLKRNSLSDVPIAFGSPQILESLSSRLSSSAKSVTVTDEDTQSRVELDFRTPSPSDQEDDPFNDSYIDRRNYQRALYRSQEPYDEDESPDEASFYNRSPSPPDSVPSSKGSGGRGTDSGFSQSTIVAQEHARGGRYRRKPRRGIVGEVERGPASEGGSSGFVVGDPDDDVYGGGERGKRIAEGVSSDRDDDEAMLRNGDESPPPDRPNWGFGPSRNVSRIEDRGHLNGYDSDDDRDRRYADEDTDRSPSRNSHYYSGPRQYKEKRYNEPSPRRTVLPQPTRTRHKLPRRERTEGTHGGVSSRFRQDLNNYKATKITLYKNGDPWFRGFEVRFVAGRDFNNLDGLFQRVSNKMDFPNGIAYMFDVHGMRVTAIDQIENGGAYICSQNKRFVPANYGKRGHDFSIDGGSLRGARPPRRVKKNNSAPSSGGSGKGAGKPNSADGRIIKIVNAEDHSVRERVLLNLKTTQAFEDVIADLGQVLKITHADRIYTKRGREIKSFSHLRNDFQEEDTFIVSAGPADPQDRYLEEFYHDAVVEDDMDHGYEDEYGDRPGSRIARYNSDPNLANGQMPRRHRDRDRDRDREVGRSLSRSDSRDAPGGRKGIVEDLEPLRINVGGVRKYVYPPTKGFYENVRAPVEKLELDWVHGYRGYDTRTSRNLFAMPSGELLYFIGTFAILYDRVMESQRVYRDHNEDIMCIDLHPDRELVVTGQRAGKTPDSRAHMRVWSSKSLETKVVLGMGECEFAVSAVAFSTLNNGGWIMCLEESKESVLTVWEWESKSALAKTETKASVINGCAFHPLDNNLLITYGKHHLVFWNKRRDGQFERSDVVKGTRVLLCITFLDSGDLVAGDRDGMVSIYSVSNEGEYYMSSEFEAHSGGGVNALLLLSENVLVTGGDRDRKLITWDVLRDFEKMEEIKLSETMGGARTIIHAKVDQPASDTNVIIGTNKNLIIEGSIDKKFNTLVWGHWGSLNAIAPHPDDLAFVTGGQDRTVAKWRKNKVSWKLTVQSEVRSISYHPGGTVVALGTEDGHMLVLKSDTGAHVTTMRVCGSPITAVPYNREGDLIAAASQNGTIYLYKVTRDGCNYKKFGKMAGGVGLLQLDWNLTGDYIQTMNQDFNLNFWNVGALKQEKFAAAFRDEEWLEQTCVVTFASSGAWNNVNCKEADADVTTTHTSANGGLLVTGDSHGFVRLFRNPIVTPRAEFHEEKPASKSVSCARFLFDDLYVVASVGRDATLVKYKVK